MKNGRHSGVSVCRFFYLLDGLDVLDALLY